MAALDFENLDIKLPDETYHVEYVVLDVQAEEQEMIRTKIMKIFPTLNVELYGLLSHNICRTRYEGNPVVRAIFDIRGPYASDGVEVDLYENNE